MILPYQNKTYTTPGKGQALSAFSLALCSLFLPLTCQAQAPQVGDPQQADLRPLWSIAAASNTPSGTPAAGTTLTTPPAPSRHNRHRRAKHSYALPMFERFSDPLGPEMSYESMQMADLLGISRQIHRVMELQHRLANHANDLPAREEMRDLKFEVLETVEETRLQIDFVCAEIDEEQVILEEAMRVFAEDRDDRVNRANKLAFRTNGVLWAIAEGLDIPTYKSPRLSIPSGTVGIVAGIVPSLFSGVATRASSGGKYSRAIYPNMLTKIYDLPTIPRVSYPDVFWQYLNSKPKGDTRTRKEVMQERWRDDNNIHIFYDGVSQKKILALTGNEPYTSDLQLISDKLIMMGQLKAVALQMSRPLLEICMAMRGKKHFPDTPAP